MILGKKVAVVLPAYNASRTLERTYREIPLDLVDEVILVDDASRDDTAQVAKRLGIANIVVHSANLGYGGNQKTCYRKALELGADIVIMLHSDYQYTPKLLPAMANVLASDIYDVCLGSRILGNGALHGGMPIYKYAANRILTLLQNLLSGEKLSEYHTGYRAFTRAALEALPLNKNSNDFIFDNQMLAQLIWGNYRIAEITCPTKYFKEASSINFRRSVRYGLGVLAISLRHFFHRIGIVRFKLFEGVERRTAKHQ